MSDRLSGTKLALFARGRFVALAAAVVYFLMLASGIFALPSDLPKMVYVARDLAQTVTGAGGGWGFFSPDVGNQIEVRFEIDDGRTILLHELVNPEVSLRMGNMYRLFVQSYGNEKAKRSVAASLSAQIFRRFPEAGRVTMIASVFRFPSLGEWKKGEREQTKEIYRITFTLNDSERAR